MRPLVFACAAALLACAGCSSSTSEADDGPVDTTLNDDSVDTNIATTNVDEDLTTDDNMSTDQGYYPDSGPPPAEAEDSDSVPDERDSEEPLTNEGPSPAVSRTGSLATLFSADDYPASALDAGEQGAVTASLRIDPSGRVSGCSVRRSSGSMTLDTATCRILVARAA